MAENMIGPLAKVIYNAHARSRKLQTTWNDLGGSEREHWMHVSAAVLSFWGEFADGVDED